MRMRMLLLFLFIASATCATAARFTLSCSKSNDLARVLKQSGVEHRRYDNAETAIRKAPRNSAVLLLADGYPERRTSIGEELFALAAEKKLRLFVEYPEAIPAMKLGERQ